MYKTVIRAAPRRILQSTSRRLLSTAAPAKKKGWGWKGTAARWGMAGGAVYYYNTSDLFTEEPEEIVHRIGDTVHAVQESKQPTIDALVEEKRVRYAEKMAEQRKREQVARAASTAEEPQAEAPTEEGEGGLEGLEEEAGQQGAFNSETGEINWDCPCLGGMAHGPCGDEFKAAFSCFVYSEEEPKGVECIDKFKGMQDCFRAHPEVYASELEDDEAEIEAELARRDEEGTEATEATPSEAAPIAKLTQAESTKKHVKEAPGSSTSTLKEIQSKPSASHDATSK